MRDSRVDPNADQNFALLSAIENKDYNIAELLVTNQRTRPALRENKILLKMIMEKAPSENLLSCIKKSMYSRNISMIIPSNYGR